MLRSPRVLGPQDQLVGISPSFSKATDSPLSKCMLLLCKETVKQSNQQPSPVAPNTTTLLPLYLTSPPNITYDLNSIKPKPTPTNIITWYPPRQGLHSAKCNHLTYKYFDFFFSFHSAQYIFPHGKQQKHLAWSDSLHPKLFSAAVSRSMSHTQPESQLLNIIFVDPPTDNSQKQNELCKLKEIVIIYPWVSARKM